MFVLPVLCTRQSVPEGGDDSFDKTYARHTL
jgi:hypothetical protein